MVIAVLFYNLQSYKQNKLLQLMKYDSAQISLATET